MVNTIFSKTFFSFEKGLFWAKKLTEELHKVWITLVVGCGKMW